MSRHEEQGGEELVLATEDLCETESERLFVDLCVRAGFRCLRIPEASGKRLPDFYVESVGVFEIKEIAASEQEVALAGQPRRMSMDARQRTIRNAIRNASSQLGYAKDRNLPGVLVLHLHRYVRFNLLDLECCCFGKRETLVEYDRDTLEPKGEPRETAGGGRKLTPQANTRISAIALLSEFPNYQINLAANQRSEKMMPKLTVLHSPFARVPLDSTRFRATTIVHSRFEYDEETGLVTRRDNVES